LWGRQGGSRKDKVPVVEFRSTHKKKKEGRNKKSQGCINNKYNQSKIKRIRQTKKRQEEDERV
jgi:hypothetical protein